ncbi:DNA-binding protein [Marinospirillum insulare]|uniref:KfrA N-terminal DNA-binding domain-containing protein n=1 Tax=Marinospirillum insulare TaxID=217169 RepID=A0ABQ5ZUF0_9GAMM|nr:DNA-binding protein [Marinospirillum insulare]GLR63805.1 hypothetical protein GCM10007878_12400 [Marinospirillum insulare]
MARMGVQYEDVVEAALQLQKQGDNPTIQRIRDWLGTGSFTTISEHLKQWRENQRNATPLEQDSQGLPASLVKIAQELWQQACLEADEKLQSYQQQADAEIRQALTDKQQALEDAQRMEEKNLLLDNKNNALLADIKQQAALLSRLETQLETSQQQLVSLTTASQEKESQAKQTIAALKAELLEQQALSQQALDKQKEEQITALAHEQQRNEENQLRWMQEVDLARQQTASLKEAAQQEAQQTKQHLAQLEKQLSASQELTQQQTLDLQGKQIREENLIKQQQQLEARSERLELQLEEKQAAWLLKLEEFNAQLTNKNQQIKELEAALASSSRPAPLIMI